jgi:hypothetical protein
MGRFHDLLDNSGDEHIIARTMVDLWVSELMREIGSTQDKDLRGLLEAWFGV